MLFLCIPLSVNAASVIYTLHIKNMSGYYINNSYVDIYDASGNHTHQTASSGVCNMTLTSGNTYYLNIYSSGYERVSRTITPTSSNTNSTVNIYYTTAYPTWNNDPLGNYSPPNHEWNQHFGWRMNNSILDYHTGVDYSRLLNGTRFGDMTIKPDVYNCHYGRIHVADSTPSIGWYYTIFNSPYYVSYLHLQSAALAEDTWIPSLEVLSKVGTPPGTVAYHLHFSVSLTHSLAKDSGAFKDPLVFID